jgi:hypothetical protein
MSTVLPSSHSFFLVVAVVVTEKADKAMSPMHKHIYSEIDNGAYIQVALQTSTTAGAVPMVGSSSKSQVMRKNADTYTKKKGDGR